VIGETKKSVILHVDAEIVRNIVVAYLSEKSYIKKASGE
jgi:hypothetical protein